MRGCNFKSRAYLCWSHLLSPMPADEEGTREEMSSTHSYYNERWSLFINHLESEKRSDINRYIRAHVLFACVSNDIIASHYVVMTSSIVFTENTKMYLKSLMFTHNSLHLASCSYTCTDTSILVRYNVREHSRNPFARAPSLFLMTPAALKSSSMNNLYLL